MPDLHPTAVVEGDVTLAEDVLVGPGCVLRGPITIGAGTRLVGHVWIEGPATIGERNVVSPFTSIGLAPQSRGYDPAEPGCGTVIGSDNVLREHVSIHRAMTDEGPTRLGDHNYLMAQTHLGHDTQAGSWITMANQSAAAGHVIIEDRVNFGGGSMVQQFARIGEGAMLSGLVGISRSVLPWNTILEGGVARALNIVGMSRAKLSRESSDAIKWIFRTVHRSGLSPRAALEALRERAEIPEVAHAIEIIETAKRGIASSRPTRGHGRAPGETGRTRRPIAISGDGTDEEE